MNQDFITFLSKQLAFSLVHNEHKLYYMGISEYIADGKFEFRNAEEKARSINLNEIWTLQYYPRTPVGFNHIASPTLEGLIDYALE